MFEFVAILLRSNKVDIQKSISINEDKSLLPCLHMLNNSLHLVPEGSKCIITTISPLHLASYLGNVEWIEQLLMKGYSANLENHYIYPLHLAIFSHQLDAARKLVENGADVKKLFNGNYSILHICISRVLIDLFILMQLLT